MKHNRHHKGFSLVEVLLGTAVFLTVAIAAYGAYTSLFRLISFNQFKILAISLANEQFEIARNMPYANVGVQGGIPNGSIPHLQTLSRGAVPFTVETIVRNVDLPFDGTIGGDPNDLSPADNKLVEISVSCAVCFGMRPIVLSGRVSPKNLETASTNGALFIRVFDANGQPVQGADVHVVNVATTSTIVIDDVTDDNGLLQLVDVPPASNAYRVSVSKAGYSSDRTYPISVANPQPTNPDATVLIQQVTQMSLSIDELASLSFSSVSPLCTPEPSFDFNLSGAKLIGDNLLKYVEDKATSGAGLLTLANMEWDSYTVTPIDAAYDLAGLSPLNPVLLNPGSDQTVQLIVVPKSVRAVLVTVKDGATGLPLSDAAVTLSQGGWSDTLTTGKGFINQTDWSGSSGQADFADPDRYWSDDGNIDVTTSPGDVMLKDLFGSYAPDGFLESSTFDTGGLSNFHEFIWSPTDQPLAAGPDSVKFQFASSATTTATWDFKGPDGSASTYYTSPNAPIYSGHNNDRFVRYRLFLTTADATTTPAVSDVSFTFTSSCTPPGQVLFSGLSSGNYNVGIVRSGYSNYAGTVNAAGNWQETIVNMAP